MQPVAEVQVAVVQGDEDVRDETCRDTGQPIRRAALLHVLRRTPSASCVELYGAYMCIAYV